MTEAGTADSTAQQETPWWVRGVALTERLRCGPPSGQHGGSPDPAERANRRLSRWRADFAQPGLFAARLGEVGLDEEGLRTLLAEAPETLAARLERPDWAEAVERVLAAAPARLPAGGSEFTWDEGFSAILAPFTEDATDQLIGAARAAGLASVADLRALGDCFRVQLSSRLVHLARRTLVLELNVLRVSDRLVGETPERRFADFVHRSGERAGLTALLTEYPVLARLLAQRAGHAVAAWRELLDRFRADRAELVATLLGGRNPGALTEIDLSAGDSHDGGRAVALLRFASGDRLVYKPRPQAVHGHFNTALRWLNDRLPNVDLRVLRLLERPGYGWLEYAAAAPCTWAAQLDSFYYRTGALLALLHALGGTDVHYENLIACADQPVLVDLETLFHPALTPAGTADGDPALHALHRSVYRIALLPHLRVGERGALDVSGLGGDKGRPLPADAVGWQAPGTDEMLLVRGPSMFRGADNRPSWNGTDADPGTFTEPLLAGFRAGYETISAHRGELTGPGGLLAIFAEDRTRVVVRDTLRYATLLDESTHPDVLRDALDRDRLLDLLWRESAGDQARWPLVGAELAELWAGDIPLLTCRPAAARPAIGGVTMAAAFAESGLARVTAQLHAMSRTDRYDQEWIIRASLATRSDGDAHRPGTPLTGRQEGTVPDPERLLAAACGIADQILTGAHDDGRRVNWLALEPIEDRHWAVMPQGAGLANGYCGTALFLAQLADLTGIERYAAVARRALRPVPEVLAALAADPEHLAAVGSGGFEGLGGISYALSQLSGLLDAPEIAGWTEQAVLLTARTVESALSADLGDRSGDCRERTGEGAWPGEEYGVLTGLAGCLAAMVAVHRTSGVPLALDTAERCAWRLAALPAQSCAPSGSAGGFASGFASGRAGVGWALLRFAAAGGGQEYAELGLRQLERAIAAHSVAGHAAAGRAAHPPTGHPAGRPTGRPRTGPPPAGRAVAGRGEGPGGSGEGTGGPSVTGWCTGAAGLALAVADSRAVAPPPGLAAFVERTVAALTDQGPLPNHSLCHGELGSLELLLTAGPDGRTMAGPAVARAGALLSSLDRLGPQCGTPNRVSSPGLLNGLAGIGHGLLRLGFGARIPSALLLQSPPP
ncbi:type 2 lanthipeptide synthetase LanM family protein [Kitasatospora sp. NPDC008050]|uniref:type 2 lanthipeptide synthetase LanM family protein n=1 Tax=Kitasatospora sp. NPDC008050 TaxID=3364021 RepID=UPI0036E7E683